MAPMSLVVAGAPEETLTINQSINLSRMFQKKLQCLCKYKYKPVQPLGWED